MARKTSSPKNRPTLSVAADMARMSSRSLSLMSLFLTSAAAMLDAARRRAPQLNWQQADLADLRNVVPQLVQLNILLPHDLLLQLRLVIDEIFVLPVGCSASRVGCCRHFASDSCETPAYLLDLQNHEEVFSHRWVGKDSCQTAQARGKVRGEAMKH